MTNRRKNILILSYVHDSAHIDGVVSAMDTKARVWRLNTDEVIANRQTTLLLDGLQQSIPVIVWDGQSLPIEQIDAVWLRKPYNFAVPINSLSPTVRAHFDSEIRAFVDGLLGIIADLNPKIVWMNQPDANYFAARKLTQLHLAQKLGFTIPHTLISNDLSAIKTAQTSQPLAIKMLDSEVIHGGDHLITMPTQPLSLSAIEALASTLMPPAIIQQSIDRAYELRVTIVGKRVFAAKIETLSRKLDWRVEQQMSTTSPITLDKKHQQLCLSLVEALHLRFAAIDLIVDTKGTHYFLEINPDGQWKWIEHQANLPISAAIAEELLS